MGRLRSLMAPGAAAILVACVGCKGTGSWKSPEGVPAAPLSPQVKPDANPIIQAGGMSPFATMPSSLNWVTGKSSGKLTDKTSKASPTEIAVAWRNHIDYLPDPTRQGAMGPGLVGQMFLFDAKDYPAAADGTLTVELIDETPRHVGQPPIKPERWQFKKDVLKSLRTVDERFGPNYVLFLPWPSYRPDVTRVRINVRFDPDQKGGFTLYAPEAKLALDPSLAGTNEIGAGPVQTSPPPSDTITPAGVSMWPASPVDNAPNAATSAAATGPGMGMIRMSRPPAPMTVPTKASTTPAGLGVASPGIPADLAPLAIINSSRR